jgi:UDP-2-acetamido-3-amino-2,3-dideoxy-glucuronate N-acetyltransferase
LSPVSAKAAVRPFTTIYAESTFGARLQTVQGASIRQGDLRGGDVFVGPHVAFTDDPHPMGCPRYQDCKGGPVVRRLARIGANSTILPGVAIGEGPLVGAGNPTRVIEQVADLTCALGWFERPYGWAPYSEP